MKNQSSKILVAAEDRAEAQSVTDRLQQDFENVRMMISAEADPVAFSQFAPDVLVLAIKGISRAEHFFLGLFRAGAASQSNACRTILLCSKEEVAVAFELCKKGYFDDYVLHWPIPYDGMRLTMSVWVACRDAAFAPRLDAPDTGELIAHVKSLDAVGTALDTKFTNEGRALLEPHMSQARQLAEKVRQMRLFVMVVEDDPLAGQVIEHILKDQAVDIAFADGAPAALTLLRRRRPDLILMDIRLPGMDGVALTKTIKATAGYEGVPIVMLTGSAKRETVAASIEAGAAGFLVKPVTRDSLMNKMRQYLPGASA